MSITEAQTQVVDTEKKLTAAKARLSMVQEAKDKTEMKLDEHRRKLVELEAFEQGFDKFAT